MPVLRRVPDWGLLPLTVVLVMLQPATVLLSGPSDSLRAAMLLLGANAVFVAHAAWVGARRRRAADVVRLEATDEIACQYAAELGISVRKRRDGGWLTRFSHATRIMSTLEIAVALDELHSIDRYSG